MLQRKERLRRRRRGGALSGRRILVAAFGDAGHAFPAIGLALALRDRGHDVVIETWERWREPIAAAGLRFQAAEQYTAFPPPAVGEGAGPARAARGLLPLLEEFDPEVVVSDILTQAPALAAELYGCPRATLVPHLYPVHQPGMPFFAFGLMPPRSRVGRGAWRAALPVLEAGLRRGRRELNETRTELGLPRIGRFHGGLSPELVLVGTYPELEHPRSWPVEVEVCGPLGFEIPHPGIELPPGSEPLVLIAPSTAHDPDCRLIRRCFEAFADEALRVVATANGQSPAEPIEVPGNGTLVDWLSYSQLLPEAAVVVCHGGHGTVCRALGAATPLLISPAIGDTAENAVRVQWAGCGLALPARLRRSGPLRWTLRELLENGSYRRRAAEIAVANPEGAAERHACEAIERLLDGR